MFNADSLPAPTNLALPPLRIFTVVSPENTPSAVPTPKDFKNSAVRQELMDKGKVGVNVGDRIILFEATN